MTKESMRFFMIVGGFIALSVIGLIYLRNKDELASNHYKLQAEKRCQRIVEKEACLERVEREHQGCYRAWIENRDGDVDGYARCMGMWEAKFEN